MKKAFVCLMIGLLAGCSSKPESKENRIVTAAKAESSRLAAPSQPLSAFADFELRPMELSAGVSERKEKVKVAEQLEARLQARLLPLIEQWKADGSRPQTGGTLLIQPKLQALRVVSGGARFWVGAWSGESFIDMNLELIDGATGATIANPRISRTASAMGGAWTIGATDKNLLNYIVEIAHQYLVDNYQP